MSSTIVIQGRTSRWWTISIHILPFGLTAILLWLSYCTKYWFPESGLHNRYVNAQAKNVLNWLQLAAKLYEIIVVASLTAITLGAFKRAFVDTGVPFGLLSGAYRIGDVCFLVDRGFWKALFRCWRSVGVVGLAALIIANTLLSILVGPASAILIVPQLDWFNLPGALSNITLAPLFYDGTPETVWPAYLNDSLWENGTHYCRLERGSVIYDCPASGYSSFFTWAYGWESTGFPDQITFQDPSGTVSRRLELSHDGENGTFATIPTALTAMTLGRFKRYVESKKKNKKIFSQTDRWKIQHDKDQVTTNLQPLVQAKCNVRNISNADIDKPLNLTFPSKKLRCFSNDTADDCHRIRNQLADLTILDGKIGKSKSVLYRIQTTDITGGAEEAPTNPSSLVFAASLPYIAPDDDFGGVHLLTCSYMAHWVPSVPVMDLSNAEMIKTNITDVRLFFNHTKPQQIEHNFRVGSTINLQQSWLPFFDLSMVDDDQQDKVTWVEAPITAAKEKEVDSDEYTIGSLLTTMVFCNTSDPEIHVFGPGTNFHNRSDPREVREAIEKFTGGLLADAISRTAAATPAFLMISADSQNATLDQLSRQQGPNSFDYTLLRSGSAIDGRGYDEPLYGVRNMKWRDLEDLKKTISRRLVTVEFEAKQYGYGFGQPGAPRTFARTVITTYCGIILLCLFLMSAFSGKTVAPWSDIQDLLALAWTSSAPRGLDEKSRIEYVAVRATDDKNLGLVLGNNSYVSLGLGEEQGKMKKLEKGVKYYSIKG